MTQPAIVWFRDDQRLADNPAVDAAVASGRPVLCVYVHDEESDGIRPLGGAAKWWLHGSLTALDAALGGRLTIVRGPGDQVIGRLAAEIGAGAVYWNHRYDHAGQEIDARLKHVLKDCGIIAESFNGHLLYEPWTAMTKSGGPFRVFTAFWRAARRSGEPETPSPGPKSIAFYDLPAGVKALRLEDLHLEPHAPDWSDGLRETWKPGEAGGRRQLKTFLEQHLVHYAAERDRPDKAVTSGLSPYLRFGNVSVREVWQAARAAAARSGCDGDLDKFLSELGWREFCYHLLFHEADIARRNIQPRFDAMPWHADAEGLRVWQRGRTGYPIVDAGMRQLWATGWMHNRVRMIVASFLAKHLLIDWRDGEAWFWDTLVDADPANNPASWQWVAGSGADAAPYFRIFNPILQGEKFDPDGAYVRQWVPELADLPPSVIHKPWTSPAKPDGYPDPIVDHAFARRRALEAFAETKGE